MSVRVGGATYAVSIATSRADGKLAATTAVQVVRDGKTLAAPSVRQFAGQAASIDAGGFRVDVDVSVPTPRS